MKSNSIVPEPGAIRYAYIAGGPPETGVLRSDRIEVCARSRRGDKRRPLITKVV